MGNPNSYQIFEVIHSLKILLQLTQERERVKWGQGRIIIKKEKYGDEK